MDGEATTARVLELEQKNAELEAHIMRQEVRIGDLAGCVQKLKAMTNEMFVEKLRLGIEREELLALLKEADARPTITEGADWWIAVKALIAKADGEQE